jgi:two-component system, OmpR family, sensor histidine kinase BaeS
MVLRASGGTVGSIPMRFRHILSSRTAHLIEATFTGSRSSAHAFPSRWPDKRSAQSAFRPKPAHYTDAGGRVSVAARRDGTTVVIDVSDNGVGIASDTLPMFSIPSFRGPSAPAKRTFLEVPDRDDRRRCTISRAVMTRPV